MSQEASQEAELPAVQQNQIRGNEQRPHDERIEQHSKRQGEPQLLHAHQRAEPEGRKSPRHDDSAARNNRSRAQHGNPNAFDSAVPLLFFFDAGHQKDIVVFADRHQDREQKHRHLPVQPAEIVGIFEIIERERHPQRHKVAEEHADDQVQRDGRFPQQDHQDEEHGGQNQQVDFHLIVIGHCFKVANARRRPDEIESQALQRCKRLAQRPGQRAVVIRRCRFDLGLERRDHAVNRSPDPGFDRRVLLNAFAVKGIGLEHHVDSRDVTTQHRDRADVILLGLFLDQCVPRPLSRGGLLAGYVFESPGSREITDIGNSQFVEPADQMADQFIQRGRPFVGAEKSTLGFNLVVGFGILFRFRRVIRNGPLVGDRRHVVIANENRQWSDITGGKMRLHGLGPFDALLRRRQFAQEPVT